MWWGNLVNFHHITPLKKWELILKYYNLYFSKYFFIGFLIFELKKIFWISKNTCIEWKNCAEWKIEETGFFKIEKRFKNNDFRLFFAKNGKFIKRSGENSKKLFSPNWFFQISILFKIKCWFQFKKPFFALKFTSGINWMGSWILVIITPTHLCVRNYRINPDHFFLYGI